MRDLPDRGLPARVDLPRRVRGVLRRRDAGQESDGVARRERRRHAGADGGGDRSAICCARSTSCRCCTASGSSRCWSTASSSGSAISSRRRSSSIATKRAPASRFPTAAPLAARGAAQRAGGARDTRLRRARARADARARRRARADRASRWSAARSDAPAPASGCSASRTTSSGAPGDEAAGFRGSLRARMGRARALAREPRQGAGRQATRAALDPSELPQRYRRLCQQLALARDRRYGTHVVERLHRLASEIHQVLYGARGEQRSRWLTLLRRRLRAHRAHGMARGARGDAAFRRAFRRAWSCSRWRVPDAALYVLPAGADRELRRDVRQGRGAPRAPRRRHRFRDVRLLHLQQRAHRFPDVRGRPAVRARHALLPALQRRRARHGRGLRDRRRATASRSIRSWRDTARSS